MIITCPYCSKETALEQLCHSCNEDLRPLLYAYDLALAHHNKAIVCIQKQEYDLAWQEISAAVEIFPLDSDIILLAWRLARELGYFSEAARILKLSRSMIPEDDYIRSADLLEKEADFYNQLQKNGNVSSDNVADLLVFHRLKELNNQLQVDSPLYKTLSKAHKTYWRLILTSGLVSILLFFIVLQRIDIVKSRRLYQQLAKQVKHTNMLVVENNSVAPKDKPKTGQTTNPQLPISHTTRDQFLRSLWDAKEYDVLATYEDSNWYVRAAKYRLIFRGFQDSQTEHKEAVNAIAQMDKWTSENTDFPSFYGDACLNLIQVYSHGPHQNLLKAETIACRLHSWVKSMPQEPEYTQYLNRNVMRLIDGKCK